MVVSQPVELVFADCDKRAAAVGAYLLNVGVETFDQSSLVSLQLQGSLPTRRILPYYMPDVAQGLWLPVHRTLPTNSQQALRFLVTLGNDREVSQDIVSLGFEPMAVSLSEIIEACATIKAGCKTQVGRIQCFKKLERPCRVSPNILVRNRAAESLQFLQAAELVRNLTELWGSANAEFLTSLEGH